MAKEGNEEGGNTQESQNGQKTLKEKIQVLFDAGATFSFGQKTPPDLKAPKYESTQPLLSGCKVEEVHDGGAWIGMTLNGGRRCKTACSKGAQKLRELAEQPERLRERFTGIHLDPVHALIAR